MRLVVLLSGEPVMVIVEEPTGVVALVLIVKTLEQLGLQDVEAKLAVAPVGSPEALKVTGWVVPARRVAVIVPLPELPWATVIVPETLLRL